jgi:hypothetical protein
LESDRPLNILAISQDFSNRNPSGACLLRILNSLADRHHVQCISGAGKPSGMHEKIQHIRALRISQLGMLVSLVSFHISHFLIWLWLVLFKRKKFDVIQTIDGESFLGTVVTFHFCSAAFLIVAREEELFTYRTLLEMLTSLQARMIHLLKSLVELYVCRSARTKAIIAVSKGLSADLERFYKPNKKPVVIVNSLP